MRINGLKQLARAVCQQWIDDGKPQNGREQVEVYANIFKQVTEQSKREHFKYARIVREGQVITP